MSRKSEHTLKSLWVDVWHEGNIIFQAILEFLAFLGLEKTTCPAALALLQLPYKLTKANENQATKVLLLHWKSSRGPDVLPHCVMSETGFCCVTYVFFVTKGALKWSLHTYNALYVLVRCNNEMQRSLHELHFESHTIGFQPNFSDSIFSHFEKLNG